MGVRCGNRWVLGSVGQQGVVVVVVVVGSDNRWAVVVTGRSGEERREFGLAGSTLAQKFYSPVLTPHSAHEYTNKTVKVGVNANREEDEVKERTVVLRQNLQSYNLTPHKEVFMHVNCEDPHNGIPSI